MNGREHGARAVWVLVGLVVLALVAAVVARVLS